MLTTFDRIVDTAFRFGLIRRVAWCLLRRGVMPDRLGAAFGRDLARQARTPFGRELVRVLTVAAVVNPDRR